MGSVWRAIQLPGARECAIKILHPSREGTELRADRFLREARAASSIESPNAVRVLDYGIDADIPFIAMELLEGQTLAQRLRSAGQLTPLETCRILEQVASALESAHELGIVHRDLKPDNIFLAETERGAVAKVLDFGIAKLADEEALARDLTETGALLGTPHYMSPEQVEGARHVDQRADLWSLGVIAFECIVGERPFKGDGLRALFGAICSRLAPVPSALCQVPRGFDAWFAKATHKDVGKRFRTAPALAAALRRVYEHELSATPTEDELEAPLPLPALPAVGGGRGRAALWILASSVLVAVASWLAVSAAPPPTAAARPSRPSAPSAQPAVAPAAPAPVPAPAVPPAPALLPASAPATLDPPAQRPRRPRRAIQLPADRLRGPEPTTGAQGGAPDIHDVDALLRDRT
jgi:serine/threonine-protein kinase